MSYYTWWTTGNDEPILIYSFGFSIGFGITFIDMMTRYVVWIVIYADLENGGRSIAANIDEGNSNDENNCVVDIEHHQESESFRPRTSQRE